MQFATHRPLKILANYRGYLQVDAAPAYEDVFAQYPGIVGVGCMAHARRYFKEALPTAAVPCAQALAIIKQLYGIERAASDRQLDATARQSLRQDQGRPILEKLHAYLQEQRAAALPKSPLGAAIGYALRNWVALTRYTEDGRLKIDNNGAEQALRPIVLGRKNWLFAGSEAAAHRTAILCSLVQTCKHLQINPFVYLRDVIERVSTHPARLVLDLTPREWQRRRRDFGVLNEYTDGLFSTCLHDKLVQFCHSHDAANSRREPAVDENFAAAQELRSLAESVAQTAVVRDYTRRPALLARYGERGRAAYLQDTRFHLSYLADSIRFGRPSIFKDYLGWVTEVLSARGVATEELLENLKCVREVLAETLAGDRLAKVLQLLDQALAEVSSARSTREPLPADGRAKRYLDFLLRGERQAAYELVQDALRSGVNIKEIWLRVFQDTQYEVGRLWQSNQISVAQEHYCTAATQNIMSRFYGQIFSVARRGRVLVTACAPSEIHEIGMRMVADFFELDGWDTHHLGANTPSASLVDFVAQRRPDLVGLSATMTFHLEAVASIVRALRANQRTRDIRVLVGGHAFGREPDLWRDIGADGYARDAEEALEAADRLLLRVAVERG